MEIIFLWKDVFGRRLYYPGNHGADALCELLNAKALSQNVFDALRQRASALGLIIISDPKD